MSLTKKQRNTVYKAMLKYAVEDEDVRYGFCKLTIRIYYSQLITSKLYFKYGGIFDFKELISFKPKTYTRYGYWFDCTYEGWEKRIEILQKCIELTN